MNTLAGRLLLSFVAVILVVGAVTVVVARRAASSGIREVMVVDQSGRMTMTDATGRRDQLVAMYARSGAWDGALAVLGETAQHQRKMGGAVHHRYRRYRRGH